MKLEVKDIYGIKDEIKFHSKKNNIIIFAPNGTGKTSIAKGLKAIEKGYSNPCGEEEFSSISIEAKINKIKEKIYFEEGKEKSKFIFIDDSIILREIMEGNFFENIYKQTDEITMETSREPLQKEFKKIFKDSAMEEHTFEEKIKYVLSVIEGEKVPEPEKDEIEKYKKAIHNLNTIKNKKTKTKKWENFLLKEKCIVGVENGHIQDKEILDTINEKKRGEHFQYRQSAEEFFSPAGESLEKLKKMLKNKVSIEEQESILSILKINDKIINKAKLGTTTVRTLIEFIEKVQQEQEENILKNKIYKGAVYLEECHKRYNKNLKWMLIEINKDIGIINNFFENGSLEWKLKIKKFDSIEDKIEISFLRGRITEKFENFLDYASAGEQRILILIAMLSRAINTDKILILDDATSSMDNHHLDEFIIVLKDEKFQNIPKLILTHSFELMRSIAHGLGEAMYDLFIMDKISIEKIIVIKGEQKEIKNIMNTKNTKGMNSLLKIIILSNIVREILNNYILDIDLQISWMDKINTKKYKEGINQGNQIKNIFEMITFIDQNIRHFKKNVKNEFIIKKFEEIFKSIIEVPIFKIILKSLKEIKEEFMLLVIKYQEKYEKEKFLNFSEYIAHKTALGLSCRFNNEKSLYYDKGEEIIKTWESEKKWRDAKSMVGKTTNNSYKTNFLAHVNNVQWTKIIEISIFKIKNMLSE